MNFQTILSNFALILFVLMLATGVVWFLDVFRFAKQRRALSDKVMVEWDARHEKEEATPALLDEREKIRKKILKQPLWIEYSGSFFPVIAVVFFLRSFLFEPFKIPSSSMLPTLEVGDLILVNKYTYGIRLPIVNKLLVPVNRPQRGDVMVFRFPRDPSLDYIKRVIGIPGDKIVYRNKRLTVNGVVAIYRPLPDYLDTERLNYSRQFTEATGVLSHRILNDDGAPSYVPNPDPFRHRNQCTYN
ncbi:MAG: signal peptidase I, partial [Burkholderiaceae bacterium]|nr:signal peptidase I [Burkholderiaceae bacterium]